MASEAGYDDVATLRRVFRVGSLGSADATLVGAGRRAICAWHGCVAQLRAWMSAMLAVLPGVAAMAGPSKPESAADRSSGSGLVESPPGGDGAPEPPPEKPTSAPPEGVAVQRYGSADLLELLRGEPVTAVLQPGEILFKEGDPGTTMYLVHSGVLRIRSGSVVYEDVAAGGIVGEMGLVEKHMPRSATVYALQQTELVEIDDERFARLVERRPTFAITVMRILSRRLRHMDRRYRIEDG